jgi:hypothetical protein
MTKGKSTALVAATFAACVLGLPENAALAGHSCPGSGKQIMTAQWTRNAPQIDGVMSPTEWRAAIPVHVNFVKPTTSPGVLMAGSVAPDNPHDSSFTIRTVYDDAYLYIAVDVADDALFLGSDPTSVWESDAVEVFIDGDRVNGCPPADDDVLGSYGIYDVWQDCAPQTGLNDFLNWDNWVAYAYGGSEETVWRVEGKEGFQLLSDFQGNNWNWYSPEFQILNWTSATGPRPRGYVVEWQIALESIDTLDGPAELPPGPGDVIGFNIAVDDNDGFGWEMQGAWEGTASGWMFLHEDEWGMLYFEPPPK